LTYIGIALIVIVILIILLFAFITRSRRSVHERSGKKPTDTTPPDERQELPAGKLAEEFYTDSDLPKTAEEQEIVLELKRSVLDINRPHHSASSEDKRRKAAAKTRLEKGDISKDTYQSILEIIDKKS
jgi:uncharacterized membrane protein